ncbi:MAG: hypothetical protein KJ995_02870, partial [Candidatus Omnitrophica bacterium]|nr:hypothetical protein [Candidatus Omnitrophota bacterium]MBU1851330.1 hypothetical protein [Candidatus Omnitrophota bacterium]
MRKKSKFTRIVALFVAGIFLHQQIAWATGGVTPVLAKNISKETINLFPEIQKGPRISDDLARIEKTHLTGSEEVIINIQDCHSSLSAQYSIVDILKDLMRNYDLRVVAVEGGAGYLDTSLLKSMPDEGVRKKTAAYLMKEGKISAGEFFTVTAKEDIALYGAEDNGLYMQNVKLFRKVYAKNRKNRAELNRILETLKHTEEKVYSGELSRLLYKSRLHDENRISFDIYWKSLEEICLKAGISTATCGNIMDFTAVVKLEKTIDFDEATRQRRALIDQLTEGADEEALEVMVARSIAYEKGGMDQAAYHRGLMDLAGQKGIKTEGFPELAKFDDYSARYSALDVIGLADELELLEERVLEELFSSDEERELYRHVKVVRLLKRLFEIQLTGKDVSYLRENIDKI